MLMKHVFVLLLLLLMACARVQSPKPEYPILTYAKSDEANLIVYSTTLHETFSVAFENAHIQTVDETYAIPSLSWVYLYNQKFAKKHRKYNGSKNYDCDNYALMYHALAQELHAKNMWWGIEAVAVGKVYYRKVIMKIDMDLVMDMTAPGADLNELEQEDGYMIIREGHAINMVVVDTDQEGMDFEVIFIEPQTGEVVKMSKSDAATVFFIEI